MSDAGVLLWLLFNLLLIVGAIVIYFVPTSIAFRRKHPSRWLIFILNVIFGATVVGWFGALIWALMAPSKGSASRLNVLENDALNVRLGVADPRSPAQDPLQWAGPLTSRVFPASEATSSNPTADPAELLAKLKRLRDEGVIDPDEYQHLRQPYLDQIMR